MENTKNVIDVELEEAQRALTAARLRKAQAEESARIAAQTALAKNLADEQERLVLAQEENKRIQEKWAKKRADEEAQKRKVEVEKAAVTRRLEAEVEVRAQAQRDEAARLERIRKVTEAAHQAELEAQQIEQNLQRTQIITEEVRPISLGDLPPALSLIFGVKSTETSGFITAISSEEQAKTAARAAQAEAAKPEWRVIKHTGNNRFVSSTASYELEKAIKKHTGIQANSQKCDLLSCDYDEADLIKALHVALEAAHGRALSHDSLLLQIQTVLDSAAEKATLDASQ